jgi:hypothetical protein
VRRQQPHRGGGHRQPGLQRRQRDRTRPRRPEVVAAGAEPILAAHSDGDGRRVIGHRLRASVWPHDIVGPVLHCRRGHRIKSGHVWASVKRPAADIHKAKPQYTSPGRTQQKTRSGCVAGIAQEPAYDVHNSENDNDSGPIASESAHLTVPPFASLPAANGKSFCDLRLLDVRLSQRLRAMRHIFKRRWARHQQ